LCTVPVCKITLQEPASDEVDKKSVEEPAAVTPTLGSAEPAADAEPVPGQPEEPAVVPGLELGPEAEDVEEELLPEMETKQ
jgi:hypothetical protein